MSALANALRAVVVKSSHPNSLVYQVQVERAKKKYVERGMLEGGQQEGAVALGAPEEKGEKAAVEVESAEAAERVSERVEGREDGKDAGSGGNGGAQ
jgi:hypothetical protein